MEIIPAILTNKLNEFNQTLNNLSFSKTIQVDIMDGKLTPNKSVDLEDLPIISNQFVEVHLMTTNPIKNLLQIKDKAYKRVIAHIETLESPYLFAMDAKNHGLEPCIAFSPQTKPRKVEGFKRYLFLTVNPGSQGQLFLENKLNEIKAFKDKNPDLIVGVDGGVNLNNITKLTFLDYVCVGSYLTKSTNPKKNYEKLVQKIGS